MHNLNVGIVEISRELQSYSSFDDGKVDLRIQFV